MDFLELAKARFSVLDYEMRPVEREKADRIVEAALAAPSACNFQPQRILVIDGDEGRRKLHAAVPNKKSAPLAFLVCYDKNECWTRPADGKQSGEIDASIAATHMMLEATALGLGSIWVMNWDPQKMREAFSLQDDIVPVALLIVGYKAENAEPRPGHLSRKSKEEILL